MPTADLKLWPDSDEGPTGRRAGIVRRALLSAGVLALLTPLQQSPGRGPSPLVLLPAQEATPLRGPSPEPLSVPTDVDRGFVLMQQGRRWEARVQLTAALTAHRSDFWGGRIQFVHGYMDVEDKRYSEALAHLRDPLLLKSGLEDLGILYQGHALFNLKDTVKAAEAFRHYVSTYPDSAFRTEAAKMLGESEAANNRALEAAEAYEEALKGMTGWEVPSVCFKAADNYRKAGSLREAHDLFQRLFLDHPTYYRDREVEAQLRSLRPRLGLTPAIPPDFHERRARSLAEAGSHRAAASEYSRLRSSDPSYFNTKGLALDLAEEAIRSGNQTLARSLLMNAVAWDTSGRASLLLGDISRDPQPHLEAASRANSPYAETALYRLFANRLAKGDRAGSGRYLNELVDRFPGSYAGLALWKQAWSLYAAGSFGDASAHFARYARACPKGPYSAACLYWEARAMERWRGSADAAPMYRAVIAAYPRTVYGYFASDRLRIPPRTDDPPPADIAAQRAAYFQEARAGMPAALQVAWDRTELLRLCRLHSLALKELSYQEKRASDRTPLLVKRAVIHHDTLAHRSSIIAMREAFPDYVTRDGTGLPRFMWEMFYPLRYEEIFRRHAQRLDLPLNLLKGVACQESCFNPVAHSGSGAMGVMQLIPSTAHLVARRYHLPYSSSYLTDPEKNIQLGSLYLAGLLRQFGDDRVYALIGYNAGPGRVTTWQKMMPGLSGLELAENALFRETRDYVLVVLQNEREYERLYGK